MGNIFRLTEFENNRENHPILNQIYDILGELYNQGKLINNVPAHKGIRQNEDADKVAKQAIDMLGITTIKTP